jgi:hypothetical protein
MKHLIAMSSVIVMTMAGVGSAFAEEPDTTPARPMLSPAAISRVVVQRTPVSAGAPRLMRRGGGRAMWTVLGALGGAVAGAYVGVKMEGRCACDDPGMKGALIGLPVGAIAGGLTGFVFGR